MVSPASSQARNRQVVGAQERRVEELRLIAGAVVGEDRHDGVARPEVAGEADRAGDVDARGAAENEPFVLGEVEDQRDRLAVRDDVGAVDADVADDRRGAAEADPFGDRVALGGGRGAGLEEVVHGRAFRVGAADDDVGLLLAQEDGCAGERAAGSDGADEGVELAVRVSPDFRSGGERSGRGGSRGCSTDRRKARRLARSPAVNRRGGGRRAGSCSGRCRASAAPRSVLRPRGGARPSSPGSASPGSR